jgi:hypothetical protein
VTKINNITGKKIKVGSVFFSLVGLNILLRSLVLGLGSPRSASARNTSNIELLNLPSLSILRTFTES